MLPNIRVQEDDGELLLLLKETNNEHVIRLKFDGHALFQDDDDDSDSDCSYSSSMEEDNDFADFEGAFPPPNNDDENHERTSNDRLQEEEEEEEEEVSFFQTMNTTTFNDDSSKNKQSPSSLPESSTDEASTIWDPSIPVTFPDDPMRTQMTISSSAFSKSNSTTKEESSAPSMVSPNSDTTAATDNHNYSSMKKSTSMASFATDATPQIENKQKNKKKHKNKKRTMVIKKPGAAAPVRNLLPKHSNIHYSSARHNKKAFPQHQQPSSSRQEEASSSSSLFAASCAPVSSAAVAATRIVTPEKASDRDHHPTCTEPQKEQDNLDRNDSIFDLHLTRTVCASGSNDSNHHNKEQQQPHTNHNPFVIPNGHSIQLFLDAMAPHQLQDALEEVASYTDILTRVQLHRSPRRRTVQPKMLRAVVSSILYCLPHLQQLEFLQWEAYDLDFVVEDLVSMTSTCSSSKLESLNMQLATGSPSRDCLQALSRMTRLQQLTLGVHDSVSFSELMKSKSLESLQVKVAGAGGNCSLTDDHVLELRQGVLNHHHPTTSKLSTIELEAPMSPSAFAMLCLTLRQNQSVQRLEVCLREVDGNLQESSSVSDSVALLLQSKHQTLRHLCIRQQQPQPQYKNHHHHHSVVRVSAQQKTRLLQALDANETLVEFVFWGAEQDDRMFRWQKEMYLMRNRRRRRAKNCSDTSCQPSTATTCASFAFNSFYSCYSSQPEEGGGMESFLESAKANAVTMGTRVQRRWERLW